MLLHLVRPCVCFGCIVLRRPALLALAALTRCSSSQADSRLPLPLSPAHSENNGVIDTTPANTFAEYTPASQPCSTVSDALGEFPGLSRHRRARKQESVNCRPALIKA
jgi:hypothetical protein